MTLTNFQIETLAKLETLVQITGEALPQMSEPENWEQNVLLLLDALAAGITSVTQGDLTTLPWSSITDKPTAYPPETHSHQWSQIQNRPTEFTPESHQHGWSDITGTPSTYPPATHTHPEYEGALTSVAWADITDKPTTFPPESHSHVVAWADVESKPSTFTPSAHSHVWTDISDRPTTWDWSNLTGVPTTFAPSTHSHAVAWADVEGKPSTFAPSTHGHPWADITDKPTAYPPDTHSHTVSWNNLTDRPTVLTSLATKAASISELSVVAWGRLGGATTPDTHLLSSTSTGLSLLGMDSKADARAFLEVPAIAHAHAWTDITGKPTFGDLATLNTVADAQVATGAAIAWSKISKSGATAADVGAAAASHSHSHTDTTLTLSSGWSQAFDSASPLRYAAGDGTNLVLLRGLVAYSGSHPTDGATIATLPSGKRPPALIHATASAQLSDGSFVQAAIAIESDGDIIYVKQSSATLAINYLLVDCTFAAS